GRRRGGPGEVGGPEAVTGDHRADRGMAERGRGVEVEDARVRERAAQDGAVQHPGQAHVVDVVPAAADEPRVLLALEAPEADRALGGPGHQACTSFGAVSAAVGWSAAQRIAATMFL